METLKVLWDLAPLWGALIVIAAIVYAVLRARRSPGPGAAQQPPESPSPAAEAEDFLDSSHIGFAPLIGALEAPPYDHGGIAGGDAKQK